VLAISVTVIEVSLIVSLMLAEGGDGATLARDTVFAAVMIILNGIVGLCLLAGGARHHEQRFVQRGVSATLAVLAAMVVLTLVLPISPRRLPVRSIQQPVGVCRGNVADSLRHLRVGADGAAPRLFPARDGRRAPGRCACRATFG